jgi:hypothetical protein
VSLVAAAALTPTLAGTLTGRVRGDDGRGLAGAMVTLTDTARGVGESVYTDAAGRYSLKAGKISGRLALRVN